MRIGIDLGGTKTAGAIVGDDGAIIERVVLPTDPRSADAVIDGIFRVCEELGIAGEKILHCVQNDNVGLTIGIGVPGTVNSKTGTVIKTPNLPLTNINLAEKINDKYNIPVFIENDANCAALGESLAGAIKDTENAVLITLGTGIGSGLILGGKLHTGMSGAAGELGHMVIFAEGRLCGCGRLGCWETYASTTALVRTAHEFMGTHRESILWNLCGGDLETLNGHMIFDAFRKEDSAARRALKSYVEFLAIGIVNIINILDPEIICIGGGISKAWDCLYPPLVDAVKAESNSLHSPSAPQIQIVQATLGNDAGIIGAAFL